MNYAVIRVPDFALHALRRGDPALAGRPVALLAGEGRKATIAEVSSEAAGIEPGLAATLAVGRCPGLLLRPRDPAAEVEAQRILLAAALTLAPRVEATAAGCCTVGLQGADPARTEAQMRWRAAELARLGLPARIGAGATPLLAAYAARCAEPVLVVDDGAGFLAPLPLAWAEPTPEQAGILERWGIRTLGELTRLPKAEIGERLGTAGVELWERAAGATARVLRPVEPCRTFVAEWAYDPPVESIEPLLFRLRRFAERVAFELRAAGLVASALALTLRLEDETEARREFRLPEPGADVDGWLRLLQGHLAGARTAARVAGVRLGATPCRPPERQDGLFETGLRDPVLFWETLARLGAVVGDDRVGTPVLADTHRPDAFVLAKPAEAVPVPAAAPVHPPRGPALRRFRPPWPAGVEVAAARPVRVECAEFSDTVAACHGPWFLSGDWWRPSPWAAETWRVELAGGGVYQLARTADGWRLEGIFD
jgi:protein ImuB